MAEQFIPRPYQVRMAEHIALNPFAALWTDMGSGKTAVTLSAIAQFLEDLDVAHVLVVAPRRVAMITWPAEIARWEQFKHLTCRVLTAEDFGFKRQEVTLKRKGKMTTVKRLVPTAPAATILAGEHIHTISRDYLQYLVQLLGKRYFPYDMIVIDESDGFRSHDSNRVKSIKVLRKHGLLGRLVELSGTPRPKSLLDLHAQIHLLDQGARLGKTLTEYRDTYFDPDKRSKDQIFSWKPKAGAEDAIFAKLSDLCVSLLPEDVVQLPERTINVIPLELKGRGRQAYDAMERDSLLELTNSDAVAPNRAALVGKLLQLAGGAVYDEDHVAHHVHDVKLGFLEELVESLNGVPLLVAYWFKHELARIKARFPNAVELNDSPDTEARWNAGEIDMLLLHPQSGAHGLNLQFNDGHGCWFGPIHDLGLWLQWNKRLHRPGRTSPVFIHVPIVTNTIEGAVLASLDPKAEGQDRLLQAVRIRIDELKGANQ